MHRASSAVMIQLGLAATGFPINFFWERLQSPLYEDVETWGPERKRVGLGREAMLTGT